MIMRSILFFMLVAVCVRGQMVRADESDDLFQTDRLWRVHLRVTADRWETMQPTRGTRLAFLLGTPRWQLPATQPADRLLETNEDAEGYRMEPVAAGLEYAYVRAVAQFDDHLLTDVGLRYRGNASYLWTAWMRRAMKVDFNRFVEDREFMGAAGLNLHNEAVDPSFLRDTLGFMMYRDAGVPAARTTFALLEMTIDGQADRHMLGLYTIVENMDKQFLKRHFGTSKGLLLKPDGIHGLPYLGEDWKEYGRYWPKTEGTPELKQRVIDLTRLIHHADDATFAKSIESYIEVNETLKFVAVCTLLSDLDSFLTVSHNFYMYVHPETKKVHFLPWDMNLGFGGVANAQSPERVVHLSVKQPAPSNRLIVRLLTIPAYREQFEKYLREGVATYFKPERVHAEIDRLQAVIRQAEEAERKSPTTMPARLMRPMPDLKTFVTQRAASVLGQLDGTVLPFGQTPPKPPATKPAPVVKPATRPAPVVKPTSRPAVVKPALGRIPAASPTSRPVRPAAAAANRQGQAVVTTRPAAVNRPTTRPAPVMPKLIPVAPPKPAPAPAPKPKKPNPIAPILMRTWDADRDGRAAQNEVVELVRVFFVMVGGPRAETIRADAVAVNLDRAGNILNTSYIAPLGPPATQPSASSQVWGETLVKKVDADADGQLTINEAAHAATTWFGQSDTNHDGTLTPEELGEGLDQLVPR